MLPIMKKGLAESKVGQPPGTIASYAAANAHNTSIELISYSKSHITEARPENVNDLNKLLENPDNHWVCFYGLSDIDAVKSIAEKNGLSELSTEDILNPDHRPTLEINDNYILVIVKMIDVKDNGELISEQVSIAITRDRVLTFQERQGDLFDAVRERLRKSKGRIRSMSVDYLALALIDIIIDNYFVVLESVAEGLEEQEIALLDQSEDVDSKKMHELKMRLFFLRKMAWPLREISTGLIRSESVLLKPESKFYFQDMQDHAIHVIETTETLREISTGLKELYLANISMKANDIMKTLTMIATIFIPLTFFAGIYGMNFENMPELKWQYGYFILLGIMFVTALGMTMFFRRRKWL